jgi:penicillin amidase
VSKRSRTIIGLLGVLVVLVAALLFFLRYQIHKSFPVTSGTISTDGLQKRADVYRDNLGIPVIEAASEHDLMFTLGFVHSQDRLWQMDLERRAGEGRLSEIFGEVTVPFDKMFRIVGIRRMSEEVERSMSEESLNRLQWYADGVNAFLEEYKGKYPVEFDMLGYEPEPWTPVHSIIVTEMMAWELNMAWWVDLTLGAIAERVGLERALEIFPSYPSTVPPTVPAESWKHIASSGQALIDVDRNYRQFMGFDGVGGGSNAWVVSPSKSVSGSVLLANDTHLHLQLPSKWYELYLRAPGYDVGGMSIPGVPGVVAGRNSDIAWGVTNLMADEADFYIEQIDSVDTTMYRYENRWLPMKFLREEIQVKGKDPVHVVIRSTHHGPIVTDIHTMLQNMHPPFVATMRWTASEISDRIDAFNRIDRARNWEEFLAGVKEFSGPGQNFVYGDTKGNIGYCCGARIPVRGKQSSTLPLPGWDKSAEWKGFVPFDQLPRVYNPPEGFIASANNKVVDESYPYHISDLWEPPSRVLRLRSVLGAGEAFSVQDFERLQNDQFSSYAQEMLPFILAACNDSTTDIPERAHVIEYLGNWNFLFSKDDIPTAIFQEFFEKLLRNLYLDEMGDDLFHDFLILANIPVRVTSRLVLEGTSAWFDDVNTAAVESRDDILRKSLIEAILALRDRFGSEMKTWRWGDLHTLILQHPFGLQKPLDKVFNIGPFPYGGGPTALVSGEYSFNKPFDVTVAASFRLITDLSKPGEMRSILPSGQSGQVFHDHYDNQTPLWLNGAYHTIRGDAASVRSPGWEHLVLEPAQ